MQQHDFLLGTTRDCESFLAAGLLFLAFEEATASKEKNEIMGVRLVREQGNK